MEMTQEGVKKVADRLIEIIQAEEENIKIIFSQGLWDNIKWHNVNGDKK